MPLGLALALASTIVWASESETHYETLKTVREEASKASSHPWAGHFSGPGDGLTGSSLAIAPSGQYCLIDYYDMGPGESARCGDLRPDGTRLIAVGDPEDWEEGRDDGPPYRIVRWGARHYMIPERKMMSFVNDVNGTEEPSYGRHGSFSAFLRSKHGHILVSGLPDLPPEFAGLLRPGLIDATAVWVGPRTHRIERIGRSEIEDCSTELRFDAGSSSGVFVGMQFHAQRGDVFSDVIVTAVTPGGSQGKVEQRDCDTDEPFVAGMRFSNRHPWRRHSVISTETLRFIVTPAGRSFPAFAEGDVQRLSFDDPFAGAKEAGFAWERVADVSVIGSFLGATELPGSRERVGAAMLRLGANFQEDLDWRVPANERDELAGKDGFAERTRYRLYRVSFAGAVLDPRGRLILDTLRVGEDYRLDWAGAARALGKPR